MSLVVGLPRRRRSLAHLEHELVDFVIRVRVESERDGSWGWSIQLQLPEWNNFPTLENVTNYISLEIALQQIA